MSDNESIQEYDEQLMAVLEAVWGEGYMSPGGDSEVDAYLQGIDLRGSNVLDIGCGLGSIDLHLVRKHKVSHIVGIDVEQPLIDRCEQLAEKYDITSETEFVLVEPGPLSFDDESFSAVTSKDSIIHIPDKDTLAKDIYRVLKPGGWFVASDWLAGYDDKPSPAMQEYLLAEGLDFGLASAANYQHALAEAGFVDIETTDRNAWYRQQARSELERMKGELYSELGDEVGREFIDHEIEVWEKMILALDEGQLRPTHLRGRKPV